MICVAVPAGVDDLQRGAAAVDRRNRQRIGDCEPRELVAMTPFAVHVHRLLEILPSHVFERADFDDARANQ